MISSAFSLLLVSLPAVLGASMDVQVGLNGTFAFDPEFVTAAPGDTINFIFNPKNHTLTQSSFLTPCVRSGDSTGFVPVADPNAPVTKTLTVGSTNPGWFYCEQTGHCGKGMVFAVNPPASTFDQFKAAAIAQNGTAAAPPAATTSTAPSSDYTTPPAPVWQTATVTVTVASSTYTTTYSSYAGTPPPTPAAVPMDHKILVGANGLTYTPSNISASVGDTVTFEFHPKNHTVTQSSFLNPCEAVSTTSGTPGFKSGFVPVDTSVTSDFPTFQITINDTAPIWGYCGQVTHCSQGMVFSINAIESGPNNFAAFQGLALRTANTTTTTPGGTTGNGTTTTGDGGKSDATAPRTMLSFTFAVGFAGILALLL